MNILRAKNLKKRYKSTVVVDNVSIEVKSGTVVGLLGPNGAGKTTLFYMMVGLVNSDEGDILFNDTIITKHAIHARAALGIGYLPQEASIFRKLTVEDNILAILQLRRDLTKSKHKSTLDALLDEFHIGHIRNTLAISLSGGERRRLEIARTLAMNPQFILLDEPFAGIDPISVIDLKKIIMHLKERGIGILITDHNVRETLDTCDKAYILNKGSLICEGTSKEILNNQRVRDVYLGNANYCDIPITDDKN
jgi:lipopolysaccharide export system ATP-binding protein